MISVFNYGRAELIGRTTHLLSDPSGGPTPERVVIDWGPVKQEYKYADVITLDVVAADTGTMSVRYVYASSTTDIGFTHKYVRTLPKYHPYFRTTQIVANKLPSHSPIRNRRDSAGHIFLNAVSEYVDLVHKFKTDTDREFSLTYVDEDVPDVVRSLSLPESRAPFVESTTILRNGCFLQASDKNLPGWIATRYNYETTDPLIGFRSYKILAVSGMNYLTQKLHSRENNLSVTVCYRNRNQHTGHMYVWYSCNDGTTGVESKALDGAVDSWNKATIELSTVNELSDVFLVIAVDEPGEVDIGYATARENDPGNESWTAREEDTPRYFVNTGPEEVDSSYTGLILTQDAMDMWYDSVPTRVSPVSLEVPHQCPDEGLHSRFHKITATDKQDIFDLPDPIANAREISVHVNGVTYTNEVDYHYLPESKQLIWTGVDLDDGDELTILYKICSVIPQDAGLPPAQSASATVVATGPNLHQFPVSAPPAVVFYRGVVWTESAFTFDKGVMTWLGPVPEEGETLYLYNDAADVPPYEIYEETSSPHYVWDVYRKRWVATMAHERHSNSIARRLVQVPDDVLQRYTHFARPIEDRFEKKKFPTILAVEFFHTHAYVVIREGDKYRLLVLDAKTPASVDYMEVVWECELPVDHNKVYYGAKFDSGDAQRLYLHGDQAVYQVRLHHDYCTVDGRELLCREEPAVAFVRVGDPSEGVLGDSYGTL